MVSLQFADVQCKGGRADALALRCLGRGGSRRDLTYSDLAAGARCCARLLLECGLERGDTVAVMTGRQPETVVAALGIWKAGGVYCPLFTDLGPDPLRTRLAMGDVRVLIVGEETYRYAVAPIRSFLPQLKHVLVVGGSVGEGCLDLRAALTSAAVCDGSLSEISGGPAMMHFTSGTTAPVVGGAAQPKAVIHDAEVVAAMSASASAMFGLTAGEMIWCTGEPGWMPHTAYGLVAPLALGATILMDSGRTTPTHCLSVLEDEPVAVWYTTPTVIRGLIGAGAAPARSFRPQSLRLAASVGEPLSADAVEWGQKVLGQPFRDTWWQTETGAIVLGHEPSQPPRAGSMGRPRAGLEVAVVHRDGQGLSVCSKETEAVGELALRVAALPPCRTLGGEHGALPAEAEGWHMTGDLVKRDAEGFFWFLGREDEVIKSGGRTIGPFEVEAALMSHPAVAEAGVVGASDPKLHERIVAFVVVNPGFEPGETLRRELHAFARGQLGQTLAPHEIRFEDDLPRTPSGKIVRRRLKDKLLESMVPAPLL